MSQEACSPQKYDRRTILFHWLTAAVVVFMWCGAHAIDWFPKGAWRVDARSVHILVGLALLALVTLRMRWRATDGARITPFPGWIGNLVRLGHGVLYGTLLAILGLGIANAWIRGDSIFGVFNIPKFGAYNAASRHALSEQVVGWHSLCANLLLVFAAGHAGLALFHQFGLRDHVLERMLPYRRRRGTDGKPAR